MDVPVSRQLARLDAWEDCDKDASGRKLTCSACFNGEWKGV